MKTAAHTVVPSQTVPTMHSESSPLISVGGALMGIIALILGIAWFTRRSGLLPAAARRRTLKVVDSCSLGNRERVVVVEVEKQWLVLGVTSGQINHLHTLEAPAMDSSAAAPEGKEGFAQLFRSRLTGRAPE